MGIEKMKDLHTCVSTTLTQDHRKLSYNVICESVKSLLHMDTLVNVKVIIAYRAGNEPSRIKPV